MPDLHGRTLTRRETLAHGPLIQAAGVRLMTLGDGAGRGVRVLEFRTGTGLRFTVLVDRAMDLHEVEHRGPVAGLARAGGRAPPGAPRRRGRGGASASRGPSRASS